MVSVAVDAKPPTTPGMRAYVVLRNHAGDAVSWGSAACVRLADCSELDAEWLSYDPANVPGPAPRRWHTALPTRGGWTAIGLGWEALLHMMTVGRAPRNPGEVSTETVTVASDPMPGYYFDRWAMRAQEQPPSPFDRLPMLHLSVNRSLMATARFKPCGTLRFRVGREFGGEEADPGCVGYVTASPGRKYYVPGEIVYVLAHPQPHDGTHYAFLRWEGRGNAWLPGHETDPAHSLNPSDASYAFRGTRCIAIRAEEGVRELTAVFCECLHGGLPNGTDGHGLDQTDPEGYLDGDVRFGDLPEGLGRFLIRDEGGDDWGCKYYIHQKLRDMAENWHAEHPDNHILFNDISQMRGGDWHPDHDSHQNGLDVDIQYMVQASGGWDIELSQSLIDEFADDDDCQYVFVGTRYQTGGKVSYLANHETHCHVRYFDPDGLPPGN